MLHLFEANAGWFRSNVRLEELLSQLPAGMHARALRYRFEADAYNYVLGRLLLKKGLEEIGRSHLFGNIRIQENGKPFLPGVFFNISHSNDLVVCALTGAGEVGIDVEQIQPVNLSDFRPFFTEKEWSFILQAPDPLLAFYRYWTRKESILKALGITLSQLHRIEINSTADFFMWEEKKWYLKDLEFREGYQAAVCSEIVIEKIEKKKLYLGDLNGS